MPDLPKRRRKKTGSGPKVPVPRAPREPETQPILGSGGLGFRSPRIPQKALAVICRSLATMLHSGLDIQNAIRMTADKLSEPRAKAGMLEVQDAIKSRGEIAESMREQGKRFPNLMTDLVQVGEHTGSLPEVFKSLAKHYETNVRLKRQFIGAIIWPVFQMVAAILVIGLLIYVLGMLQGPADGKNSLRFDIFGLSGTRGTITWFVSTFGTIGMIFVGYKLIMRNLAGRQFLDPLLMKIPVVGKCMRSFAIARFSWAFALTQQSGMPIKPSIHQSIRATDNGAFIVCEDLVWQRLSEGETLTDSLDCTNLFPPEFVQTVHVAETSGTVPEALDRLSPQFEEEAQRNLQALTAAAGWGVWALVAVFVVYLIFTIALQYVGMINDAASGNF